MGQADSLVMEYLPWPFTVCSKLQNFIYVHDTPDTFVRFVYKGKAILSFRRKLKT